MSILFALALGKDSYPWGMLQYWYWYFSVVKDVNVLNNFQFVILFIRGMYLLGMNESFGHCALSTFLRQLFKWFVQLCSDIVFIRDALGIKSKRPFSVSFWRKKLVAFVLFSLQTLRECVCMCVCLYAEVQKRLDVCIISFSVIYNITIVSHVFSLFLCQINCC